MQLPETILQWMEREWAKLRIMRKVWTWHDGVESLYHRLVERTIPKEEITTLEEAWAYCRARDATIDHLRGIIQDLNIKCSSLEQDLMDLRVEKRN